MNPETLRPITRTEPEKCHVCQTAASGVFGTTLVEGICTDCLDRYGPALTKAHTDTPFDYAIKLTTGEVYRTTGVTIQGDWVTIHPANPETGIEGRVARTKETDATMPFTRGLAVPLWVIAWVADAPFGS